MARAHARNRENPRPLRALGSAGIDRSRRLAEVRFSRSERDTLTARVTATSLAMSLGPPAEKSVDPVHTVLRDRYTPVPAESKHGVCAIAFTFDSPTGQLQRLHGRSPVGQLSFHFDPAPLPASAAPSP